MQRSSIAAWVAYAAAASLAPTVNADPGTLLRSPQEAQVNVASSPKFNARVTVVGANPVTATVLRVDSAVQEIELNAGAKQGVRFGHAFQVLAADSDECLAIAKVMELGPDRAIAKVVQIISPTAKVSPSLRDLKAVCSIPGADSKPHSIECRLGPEIWRTESLENKIIRGLLESAGRDTHILIVQKE